MIAALLAAVAVALLVPSGFGRTRARRMWATQPAAKRPASDLLAAALTPLAALLIVGWPWGLLVGVAAAPVVRDVLRRAESAADRRRSQELRLQLPGALDLVSAALAAGRPPASALAVVAAAIDAPLSDEMARIAHRLGVAGDARSALVDVPESLNVLAHAFRRAEDSGAPIADVVGAAADDARRESAAQRREFARRVGVRTAAPLGLCFLPAFLLVGIVPTVIAIASTAIPL